MPKIPPQLLLRGRSRQPRPSALLLAFALPLLLFLLTEELASSPSSSSSSSSSSSPSGLLRWGRKGRFPANGGGDKGHPLLPPSWTSPRTLGRTVLAETPYARCSVHTVAPEGWSGTTGDGNGDGTTDERGTAAAAAAAEAAVVNDWIFLEERSAVNVAVRMAAGGGQIRSVPAGEVRHPWTHPGSRGRIRRGRGEPVPGCKEGGVRGAGGGIGRYPRGGAEIGGGGGGGDRGGE